MKPKSNLWLPLLLMAVFAATRWPGVLPPNFSAAYALVFCAGVYLPGRLAWWVPLVVILATDIALNCYYQFVRGFDSFKWTLLVNYLAYGLALWLGRKFGSKASLVKLMSGGILAAILFYLVTNIASWFFNPFGNPEYTRTLAGLLTALTKGTAGWPETWEMFRNTLLSGGIFTGLFAGAMKLTEAAESAREKEAASPAPPDEAEAEPAPPEAKAEA